MFPLSNSLLLLYSAYLVHIAPGEYEVFYREFQACFFLLRAKTKSTEGGNINTTVEGKPTRPLSVLTGQCIGQIDT